MPPPGLLTDQSTTAYLNSRHFGLHYFRDILCHVPDQLLSVPPLNISTRSLEGVEAVFLRRKRKLTTVSFCLEETDYLTSLKSNINVVSKNFNCFGKASNANMSEL